MYLFFSANHDHYEWAESQEYLTHGNDGKFIEYYYIILIFIGIDAGVN